MSYRNKAKALKPMFKTLEDMFTNERDAGMFLAIICDLLQASCKGVDQRILRTITLTINGYFTAEYDFETDEVVMKNGGQEV